MTATRICSRVASLALVCGLYAGTAAGQTITQIIDSTGNGAGNQFSAPQAIAVANDGTVYVASGFDISGPDFPHRIFKIETDGVVTQFFDGSDGTCIGPSGIAIDDSENIYVACGGSLDAVKIDPGGTVTEIINTTNALPLGLFGPTAIAVDASGNVYVADMGIGIGLAYKIEPGGAITLWFPDLDNGFNFGPMTRIAVDSAQNVYVSGGSALLVTNRVAMIDAAGNATVIATETGDGDDAIDALSGIAVDPTGNVYVVSIEGDNAFKITPGGVITEIIDSTGDGMGNGLRSPRGIAVDGNGVVYVISSSEPYNAFSIEPDGTITQIIDATGDGAGNMLRAPSSIAVDASGNVYVTGLLSNNAFKIEPAQSEPVPTISEWGLVTMCLLILTAGTLVYSRRAAVIA
jgi:sugar lactone lactonase YvrE